jgi:hypothetical protein
LKAVVSRRLDIEISKEQQVSDWSKEDLAIEQIEYAAKDVDLLPKIAADQLKELAEEALLDVYSLESKCIRPVALMCHKGFNVDVSKLVALRSAIQTKLDQITLEFCTKLDSALPPELKLPRKVDGSLAIGKNLRKEFNPGSGSSALSASKHLALHFQSIQEQESRLLIRSSSQSSTATTLYSTYIESAPRLRLSWSTLRNLLRM